jgi:hypothetical protein
MEYDIQDKRLNPEFISNKLLAEFNKTKMEEDNYTAEINYPYQDEFNIVIKNNGLECYKLDMPEYDYDSEKYVILGGLNTKCSNHRNSGTNNLLNVVRFGKNNGYDRFDLLNVSGIMFNSDDDEYKIEINLTYLKLLTIGNTWYSQFKFQNDFTIYNEPILKKNINYTFEEFINKYNDFIKTNTIFKNETNNKKQKMNYEFESNILKYIIFFDNLCGINIDIHTKISDCFLILQDCIFRMNKELKKDEFKEKVKKLNDFIVYVLVNIFRINYGPNDDEFWFNSSEVSHIFGRNPDNIYINNSLNNEKLLELIKNQYRNLTLNFRELRTEFGGNKKSTKGRKVKSRKFIKSLKIKKIKKRKSKTRKTKKM